MKRKPKPGNEDCSNERRDVAHPRPHRRISVVWNVARRPAIPSSYYCWNFFRSSENEGISENHQKEPVIGTSTIVFYSQGGSAMPGISGSPIL